MDNPVAVDSNPPDPFELVHTTQQAPPYSHGYGYGVGDLPSGFQKQNWATHLQPSPTQSRAVPLRPLSVATGVMRANAQQTLRMASMENHQRSPSELLGDTPLGPCLSSTFNTAEHAGDSPSAAKRQRIGGDLAIEKLFNDTSALRRSSVDTHSSQCCSSCSEGEPCAEPSCEIQKEAVVACMQPECKQPPCPDECLGAALGGGATLYQGIVTSSTRLSDWNYSAWNPQLQRSSSQIPSDLFRVADEMDLTGQPGELRSQPQPGPSSTFPTLSVASHMVASFSPTEPLATPRSMNSAQIEQRSAPGSILSGTGMMFNAQSSEWPQQSHNTTGLGNGTPTFNCEWNGCAQPFGNHQEWADHIHVAHVDPQMSFYCPMPTANCPLTIGRHPIHHLEEDHGFDFLMNNEFSCPAPDCDSGQVFLNPKMLHNHFDQAHAMPAAGSFVCRWNSCDTAFTAPHELFDHLNRRHQLNTLLGPCLNSGPPSNEELDAPYPSIIPDLISSEDDDTGNVCKWKTGHGSVCGTVCETEKLLQVHIKEAHLKSLNNRVGYNCQWQGCSRPAKLGKKAGFSARGKLERHMASHTGCRHYHLTPEIAEPC
jgi:hypothetical protein